MQYDDYVLNMGTILDQLRKEIAFKVNNYMVSYFCERMDCYVYVGINLPEKMEETKGKQEEPTRDKEIKDAKGANERVADILILSEYSS